MDIYIEILINSSLKYLGNHGTKMEIKFGNTPLIISYKILNQK